MSNTSPCPFRVSVEKNFWSDFDTIFESKQTATPSSVRRRQIFKLRHRFNETKQKSARLVNSLIDWSAQFLQDSEWQWRIKQNLKAVHDMTSSLMTLRLHIFFLCGLLGNDKANNAKTKGWQDSWYPSLSKTRKKGTEIVPSLCECTQNGGFKKQKNKIKTCD